MRLEQESYEPLVIERHGELISVAHYFEQGSDLIADPDVELHFPDWTPTAIQMSSGFYTQKIIQRDGAIYVNIAFDPSVRSERSSFAGDVGAKHPSAGMGKPGRSESP